MATVRSPLLGFIALAIVAVTLGVVAQPRGGGPPAVAPDANGECPPGTTEVRVGRCQKPESPAPSILDYRPRSEQNVFLNACDVGLVALIKGMWGTAMPSRTYNIMAAGKPVLALTEAGSELAQVIDEEGIGWHIEPGDDEMLTATILDIYERRTQLSEIGQRASDAAIAKYSTATAVESYRKALL